MTDQDYIRKAVELADGWSIPETPELTYCAPNFDPLCHGHFNDYVDEMPQWHKDALAAQLVRQVDGLSDYSGVRVRPDITELFLDQGAMAIATGDNRTMNTIKAIVDSKELKNAS